MIKTAAGLRIHPSWDVETTTTVTTCCDPWPAGQCPDRRSRRARKAIVAIVRSWRPDLLDQLGVGPDRGRDRALCLVPPRPGPLRGRLRHARRRRTDPRVNSGQITNRHRLNRYGDRQLNRALHTIVLSRIRYDAAHPRLRRPPHQPKARPTARSNAASSATSPATSTDNSNSRQSLLDDP